MLYRAPENQPKQKIRLNASLFSFLGALFFTLLITIGSIFELVDIPISIFYLIILFFIGCSGFIYLIATDINLKFDDPNLTLYQVIWATLCLAPTPYLAPMLTEVIALPNILILLLASGNLPTKHFFGIVIFMSLNYGANIVVTSSDGEIGFSILMLWGCFTYIACSLGLSSSNIRHMKSELHKSKSRLSEAIETKNQFLANMSHEIRTPMNAISGMAILLLNSSLNEEQHEYARTIDTSTQALLDIVNDILDYSKIHEGGLKISAGPFNLESMAHHLIEQHTPHAKGKNLLLELDIGNDIPLEVIGDESRVRQLLNHFFSNAIKFTYFGSIILRISILAKGTDEVDIEFSVIDTGIGLQGNADDIFSRHTQDAESANQLFAGSGIGLAICKKLSHLMDGSVGVESNPHGGSRFWFEVGLRINKMESAHEKRTNTIKKELAGLSCIVCQRHPQSADITRKLLTHWGMNVITCSTGTEIIELFSLTKETNAVYDFLLISDNLEDMSIEEIATSIGTVSNGNKTKVVVLPQHPKRGDRRYYQGLGIHGYIPIPFRGTLLGQAMLTILSTNSYSESHSLVTRYTSDVEPPRQRFQDCKSIKANILLVEDNIVNQRVAVAFLKKFGCIVDVADNGEMAIEQFQKKFYDLILADCQMPIVDGYEMSRRIRMIESGTRRIPIIAVTAGNTEAEKEKCLHSGMDDHITKPITKDSIYAVLCRYCPTHKLEE